MGNQDDAHRKRKPQPWDSLRTRTELEVYADANGKSRQWVTHVLNARIEKRKGGR